MDTYPILDKNPSQAWRRDLPRPGPFLILPFRTCLQERTTAATPPQWQGNRCGFRVKMAASRSAKWRSAIWTRRCNCWSSVPNTLREHREQRSRLRETRQWSAAPPPDRPRRTLAPIYRSTQASPRNASAPARPLRCDDAENDPRVNRESCRACGIASLVVMPLVRGDEVYGVFELLAGRANAFEERDFIALQRLSEMIQTAVDLAEAARRAEKGPGWQAYSAITKGYIEFTST